MILSNYFKGATLKLSGIFLFFLFVLGLLLPIMPFAELLIGLPRTEGSKSFDMEINQLNNIGIKHHSLNELDQADESLKKATNLAKQLRDPSLGVISFNRAVILHKLHQSKEAEKYFNLAKKYARGDIRILNSKLLRNYTN